MEQRLEPCDVVYFRPDQIEETEQEANHLAGMLNAPPHIATQISDRQGLARNLQNLKKALQRHSPTPYVGDQMDKARERAAKLEEKMKADMPTHEEMRVGGTGMADKELKWLKKNKDNANEWKNLQTRMHVTECQGGRIERVKDLGNVDRFRPWGKADVTDAQIKTTAYHFAPGPVTQSVIFNDEEIATVQKLQPDLAGMLGQMTNEQRALLKSLLLNDDDDDEKRKRGEVASERGMKRRGFKKRGPLTDEQRAKAIENLARAREARKAGKEAAED